MLNSVVNILSNPTFANVAQNTTVSVSLETGAKAIGRPAFILGDKNLNNEAKKYAATKEFLYQLICLGVYFALIPPIFKKGSFALAKKIYGKTHPEFSKFKDMNEYLDYHKYATRNIKDRKLSLDKLNAKNKFTHDGLREALLNNVNPERYPLIKGAIEVGSFIGSIIGLTILAPQISHAILHPIMKYCGLEKKEENKSKTPPKRLSAVS